MDSGRIIAYTYMTCAKNIVTVTLIIAAHNSGWTTRGNKSFNTSQLTVKSCSSSPSPMTPDFSGSLIIADLYIFILNSVSIENIAVCVSSLSAYLKTARKMPDALTIVMPTASVERAG